MLAGCGFEDITCQVGSPLAGQLEPRISTWVLDRLEANALYLEAETQVLLINCDLLLLGTDYTNKLCQEISRQTSIPRDKILISCTHTHAGPYTPGFGNYKVDEEYMDLFGKKMISLARRAVEGKRPVSVGWGRGEAQVGYNRRVCWEDGHHTMYGDFRAPGFNGLEGPADPTHTVLYLVDQKTGEPLCIVQNNSCHSTCVEAFDCITGDFPSQARQQLRNCLGEKLTVLYLQGASGDLSPWDLFIPADNREQERYLRRIQIGNLLAAETLRLVATCRCFDNPEFSHSQETIQVGVRNQAKELPRLSIHALRIGDWGLVTNPCELYCQFGLEIKRRSPAPITALAQLTDGYAGYCPTAMGIMGGGYSAEVNDWCYLEAAAGYKLVDTSVRLLYSLWG